MPGFPSVWFIELASRARYVDVSKLPLETDHSALLKTADSGGLIPEAFEKSKPRRGIWQSHSSTSFGTFDA